MTKIALKITGKYEGYNVYEDTETGKEYIRFMDVREIASLVDKLKCPIKDKELKQEANNVINNSEELYLLFDRAKTNLEKSQDIIEKSQDLEELRNASKLLMYAQSLSIELVHSQFQDLHKGAETVIKEGTPTDKLKTGDKNRS